MSKRKRRILASSPAAAVVDYAGPTTRAGAPRTRLSPRMLDAITLLVLALSVLWVYRAFDLLAAGGAKTLSGGDFVTLHQRRIDFAQQALFNPDGPKHLPAWYPRELLGTPFWSNLQNFPLIPTRLLAIVAVDAWHVQDVAVNLAALLAALFTYLLCLRLGVGRVGSAAAGWTFACAGFFASRVMVGHLPLLEAYPALPLLLWLAERHATSTSPQDARLNLFALGLSSACVMLAGHPQLPIYAIGATIIYLAARALGRRFLLGTSAIVAGIACAGAALYPMALLIGRSTRVLPLARADNDVAIPLWRLKAYLMPWAEGWPDSVVGRGVHVPFARADNVVFWDTVCYVGIVPLIAVVSLGVRALWLRRMPARPWLIITLLGAAALLLALEPVQSALPKGPWTILRSPARQLYVTTFALALAAGVAIDLLVRSRRAVAIAAAAVLLLVHAFDLRTHDNGFIAAIDNPGRSDVSSGVIDIPPGSRLAMDLRLVHQSNRLLDDVGVFDSILLARPYQAMAALAGWPPDLNRQFIDGAEFGPRGLAWGGARAVVTQAHRVPGLPLVGGNEFLVAYEVPNALPRAGFVPLAGVRTLDEEQTLAAMRDGASPDAGVVYLPAPPKLSPSPTTTTAPAAPRAEVKYTRPSTDEIIVQVSAHDPGIVRILESWDPGWRATVDGRDADVLLADAFVMAVAVEPGTHEIRLTYSTPGVGIGVAFSLLGLASLALVTFMGGRQLARVAPDPPAPMPASP